MCGAIFFGVADWCMVVGFGDRLSDCVSVTWPRVTCAGAGASWIFNGVNGLPLLALGWTGSFVAVIPEKN